MLLYLHFFVYFRIHSQVKLDGMIIYIICLVMVLFVKDLNLDFLNDERNSIFLVLSLI